MIPPTPRKQNGTSVQAQAAGRWFRGASDVPGRRCHGGTQADSTGLQDVLGVFRLQGALHGLLRAEDALPNKGGQTTSEQRPEPKHPGKTKGIRKIPGEVQREGIKATERVGERGEGTDG